MAEREILLLGNPNLYKICDEVKKEEISSLDTVVSDLRDTLFSFRKKYGVGRAIAAPQIGCSKRLIYMCIDEPLVFINPVFEYKSIEMFEVWDDCMSFPNLLVLVERHKEVRIRYYDFEYKEKYLDMKDSLSELIQHEMDHLDGVLAVMRAKDKYSFKYIYK